MEDTYRTVNPELRSALTRIKSLSDRLARANSGSFTTEHGMREIQTNLAALYRVAIEGLSQFPPAKEESAVAKVAAMKRTRR